MTRGSPRARARRRAGKRLAEIIAEYALDLRQVRKDTGIDLITLENLARFTPHVSTIERVAEYLEGIARQRQEERAKEKRAKEASSASDVVCAAAKT